MADAQGRRTLRNNYQPNVSTEYRRFSADYFTGADVRIYLRDIWIDEITNLQFTLQENVAPIFGYCSTTWDKVARGSRHVQGSFTINFKESYYLHSVIERLESSLKDEDGDGVYESNGFSEEAFKEGSTIEHLLGANDWAFEKLADDFEDSLWGASGSQVVNTRRDQREKGSYFYGNGGLRDTGFNILVAYGPMNEVNGRMVDQTVHSILGVQLTGVSQIVGTDGQPIQEQYQFIAKDLDANVSDVWGKSTPNRYKHGGPGGPQMIK